MQEQIEQELARLGGRSSCIVMRMEKAVPQDLVSINPNTLYPAASLVKVPILLEVARQVASGRLSWEEGHAVPEAARATSAGVLADLSAELRLSVHDLAHLMITISDNTAANVLLDLVGMDAVNATMQELGLPSIRLERHFMDLEARAAGRDNWATAGDMARLFAYLCTPEVPEREHIIDFLLQQNDTTILPAYWGEDIPFAHKTGGLAGIIHDAGILFPQQKPDMPLIIVAMTADQSDEPLTRYVLARVGQLIYQRPT
ncbi:serine hydrolase [Ktedonosporobacter rubrisoli]|uniref:Serine hydrolase n=1 Tax=Ktedonosporobacter rubrisoli TaxID=2509675 RepID=A0A4P6JVW5_KTERU|nr:serine hydrolase [Ktedonosporobacter rubrisoli]QBD79500.1 serine hydrolase [Ktedonosporobacter rubrisoli]